MVCAIDQAPFGQTHFAEGTKAAGTVRRKNPMSLSIVSCYLIANGIFQIGWSIMIGQYIGNVPVLNIIYGVLVLFISSGLRRCSRGWRICALVVIWVGFIGLAWTAYGLLLRYFFTVAHKPINDHPVGFYVTQANQISVVFLVTSLAVHFLVQIWQYRVLTRPAIRDLFYHEPDVAA
jgi:vacuolar-type H+-ATPase subunit I/STV1